MVRRVECLYAERDRESAVPLNPKIMKALSKNLQLLNISGCDNIPVDVLLSNSFLPDVYGVPQEEWNKISALKEIVAEFIGKQAPKKRTIRNAMDVYDIMSPLISNLEYEEMWILFLNRSNRIIDKKMITRGTTYTTQVDNPRIIRLALSCNATGIIMVHNHPSDDTSPSSSDIKSTEDLRSCCKVMGITLIDHVIVGKSSYFSFAEDHKYEL